MTEPIELDDLLPERVVSRRNMLLGAGATALGVGAALSMGGTAQAVAPQFAPQPEVLGATVAGLQYIALDALDFFVDGAYTGGQDPRYIDPLTGAGIAFGGGHTSGQLAASIPLPVGSVIRQINVSYVGTPIINVYAKSLANPTTPTLHISKSLASGGGTKTQTINLNGSSASLAPIKINGSATYTLRFYVSPGTSIHGATIGYTPKLEGFIPVTGHQRVLDTRVTGGKLKPNEERKVAVGLAGARSAVFSVAVVNTEGAGSVACFAANVAYPLNSSINWFGSGQTLSNTVISAVDSKGAIKIRGGKNRTHVVIDRIGYFY